MEEEKHYSVYMHENKTNKKKYIGMTGKDPEIRWRKGTNYRTCIAFRRAIEKYGWDGFDHVVLYTGLTREEACEKEQELIAQYQTTNPEFGYNICAGGGGMVGFHHSEETKQKLREKNSGMNNPNYGKKMPEEWIEHLREIRKNFRHTEETKRRISESLLNGHYHQSEKQKQIVRERSSHPVRRDDGVIFLTVKEAAASIGVKYSAISNSIRRKQRSGGYYWEYVDKESLTIIPGGSTA